MRRFAFPILLAGVLATPCVAEGSGPHPAIPKGAPSFDYPNEAIRRGQEGRVAYKVTIDETGRVTSCVVTSSSGYPLLDEGTCRAMRNVRFEPARDADGAPTTGNFESAWIYDLR